VWSCGDKPADVLGLIGDWAVVATEGGWNSDRAGFGAETSPEDGMVSPGAADAALTMRLVDCGESFKAACEMLHSG
jgi:hypothetical protein